MSLDLYCLAHAGGDARMFAAWSRRLPSTVRVRPVQRPGRGERVREAPQPDIDLALAEVVGAVGDKPRPYALFGHSLGAVLAFEAARELSRRRPGPALLVVSGFRAPHLPARAPSVHDLPDAAFVDRLAALGGTPSSVLASSGFLRMTLPAMRADFTMAETYRHRPAMPLSCPILALGGQEDPDVGTDDLARWDEHTTAGCTVETFPGGHFFLTEDPDPVLGRLTAHLRTAGA